MQTISNTLLFILSFGVAGYAAFAYGLLPLGSLAHPDMQANFVAHPVGIYTHVFASALALVVGPFQFFSYPKRGYLLLHRWLGRLYLAVGVLLGGLSGLYMSQFAYGGAFSKVGFGMLSFLWLYTGWRAFTAIWQRNIDEHRRWMIRNFALTFAAVTLRIYLPAFMALDFDFDTAYPLVAWISWVPNLVYVEWRYHTNLRRYSALPIPDQKGLTLMEIIAALVIMGILAAIAVPRYIDLERNTRNRALDNGVKELNALEILVWSDQKISGTGYIDDASLFGSIDYDIGTNYVWDTGDPRATGGIMIFRGESFTLSRKASTVDSPAIWDRVP
jgi:prepilin-type N-terminal cleavage/methylation domain-containing protein